MKIYGCLILFIIIFLAPAGTGDGKLMAAENESSVVNLENDSIFLQTESVQNALPPLLKHNDSIAYKPDPKKAIWLSALCPGLGQLYNRRYWKLPFIGAGILGTVYAIGWNTKYYNAYTNAYRDILDSDPSTNSYLKFFPPGTTISDPSYLKTVVSNRQQAYRRQRDLSYMGAVGVYVISLLDAFVDAQLYDFDISPDLSVSPKIGKNVYNGFETLEFGLAFHF